MEGNTLREYTDIFHRWISGLNETDIIDTVNSKVQIIRIVIMIITQLQNLPTNFAVSSKIQML